jgi:uncharacterized protein YndB with AHSA1/START domain
MPDITTPVAPVRKTVTVPIPPARAFEIFTNEIGLWWPLASHSVGLEHATAVSMGTAVGDQVVELKDDGTTSVWGTVVRSDPPNELALTWHAGRPAENPTLLEITFRLAPGGTDVELVHSGWERWANGGATANAYREGWIPVLSRFQAHAANSTA